MFIFSVEPLVGESLAYENVQINFSSLNFSLTGDFKKIYCTMTSRLVGTGLRVVYVTVPNQAVANQIARSVVGEKLAACVNIIPGLKSVYEWEGKMNEDDELLLIMKTHEDNIKQLEEAVMKMHPYDVPEFITLAVDHASEQYGKWIVSQTAKP